MRKLIFLIALVSSLAVMAQIEPHTYRTIDTILRFPQNAWATKAVYVRATISIDGFMRPGIFTFPGKGEQSSRPADNQLYGPHHWLNNGWDGGVKLGNGTHYPNYFTIHGDDANNGLSSQVVYWSVDALCKIYNVNRKAVHLAGLSMGAWAIAGLILTENVKGDEMGMKLPTSIVCLSGSSVMAPGTIAFPMNGHWAKKYGGKYLGLVGWADNAQTAHPVAKAMNDSVPGSGYAAFEILAGGGHGGWNDMYNPANIHWNTIVPAGTYITTGAFPNMQGSYRDGQGIFQWMLAQGDTTMVGPAPIVVLPPIITPRKVVGIQININGTMISIPIIGAIITYDDGTIQK